jgi:hypothetical protein
MPSVSLAYGQRANLSAAIKNGTVPTGSMVITPSGEFLFYDGDETLVTIQDKNKFNSEEEALAYIQSYACDGNLISVKDDTGNYGAYLVDKGALYSLNGGTTPINAITEAATHFDFPNVGVSNHLYIATEENGGHGYIYRWDVEDSKYYVPADLNEDTQQIYGGSADELL